MLYVRNICGRLGLVHSNKFSHNESCLICAVIEQMLATLEAQLNYAIFFGGPKIQEYKSVHDMQVFVMAGSMAVGNVENAHAAFKKLMFRYTKNIGNILADIDIHKVRDALDIAYEHVRRYRDFFDEQRKPDKNDVDCIVEFYDRMYFLYCDMERDIVKLSSLLKYQ